MNNADQIVRLLHDTLDAHPHLTPLLETSLRQAHRRAEADLNPDLFAVLDWPTTLADYDTYLRGFVRWIPRQSDAAAWKVSAPHQRYAKEVSDRLGHFFWLVDQKVDGGDGSAIAENSEEFRDWLTAFARHWGSFLNTPESFDRDVLDSFIRDSPEYKVEESLVDGEPNMPSGWRTFNQFFARELNAGLRPIAEPGTNLVVTSPADCVFQHVYDIDDESRIPATPIKGTHYGTITELIKGSRYADTFAGGTFSHYMLPPSAYHRFHTPVAGQVQESFVIDGRVFMEVDLVDHELSSSDSATTGYEFTQVRGVLTLDTSGSAYGDVGIVAVIPVGMSHVASVTLTASAGVHVAKGEEFGYFQFGGSDIIVLFQPGRNPQVDTSTDYRLVGSPIATVPITAP